MATTLALAGLLARDSRSPDDRGDGELLKHYRDSRSEAAFDELIHRFAPLVWKICLRTVGQRELAEDAFQAVFLVLVRKADSIRPPSSLGGWLHTVAFHTSLRARAMADRRRHAALDFEPRAVESPDAIDPHWLRILDEEIAGLPVKLRSAVTLCELDGLSRSAAAARLGIAEGTVSSRLAAARKRLAERLRARGVGLSVAVGFSLLAATTAGAAPPLAEVASGAASALAAGAIRSLFLVKLKAASIAMVALATLACGWGAFAGELQTPDSRSSRVPILAPVPKPHEGRIFVWIGDQPLLLKPDGTKLDSPEAIPDATMMVRPRNAELSPDGKRIAFRGEQSPLPKEPDGSYSRGGVRILTLGGKDKPKVIEQVLAWNSYWLGDPDKLFVNGRELADDGTVRGGSASWVYDLKTGKRDERAIPKDFFPMAVAPDGKTAVLEQSFQIKDVSHHQQVYLGTFDGEKPVALFDPGTILHSSHPPAFSRDGRRVLMRVEEWANMKPSKTGRFAGDWKADRLVVVDVATKKATTIVDWKVNGGPSGWKWSPDGKRIAYIQLNRNKGVDGPLTVTVSDADGKNAKDILKAESTMGHVGDTGLTLAWSPDGQRLAYVHQSAGPLDRFNRAVYGARVVVMDADGSNSKEIFEAKDCSWVLMGFDWK